MGLKDKITGRAKKAAGEIVDDPSLRRSGQKDERKAQAEEELEQAQAEAARKAQEVSDIERRE